MFKSTYIKLFIKFLFYNPLWDPPVRSYRNIIINIFGFQVYRLIIENFLINIKSLFYKRKLSLNDNDLAFLKKNGYLIINNFYSKEEFIKFKSAITYLNKKKLFRDLKGGTISEKLANISVLKNENKKIYNQILPLIKSKNLNIIAEHIIKRNVDFISDPGFRESCLFDDKDKDDMDSEFHSDKHFPSCKMFLYLNDHKKENGAFTYMPGSHRLSFKKIKFEYFYSIFDSTNIFDKYMNQLGFIRKNNRVTLKNHILKKNYGKFKICSAKKNSLLIFNNMGLHKRGKILIRNKKRQILGFSFYDNQINNFILKLRRFIFKKNNRLFLKVN